MNRSYCGMNCNGGETVTENHLPSHKKNSVIVIEAEADRATILLRKTSEVLLSFSKMNRMKYLWNKSNLWVFIRNCLNVKNKRHATIYWTLSGLFRFIGNPVRQLAD